MSKKADVSSAALTNLYIELNKAGKSEEFDKAIKVANKILSLDKGASKAFHYKIICFINAGKFQDALKQLGASSKMASGLHFEKAYCEYRLNRNEAALQTLDACGDDSLRAKELRAQIFYRLERFREAHKEFRDVIKNTDDDFNDEREANLAAVLAQLQQTDSSAPELSSSEQQLTAAGGATYEQLYNAACRQLAGGEYQRAADTLTAAADLCRRTMQQDDAEPDEIHQETAVIHVQRGYCLQRLGQASEASAVYHDTLRRRPADPAVLTAASNNIVAINGDQNVFDSRKRIKALSGEGLDKLTSGQRKQLAVNQCLFSLFTHQGEQLQRHLTALAEQYPEEVVTCALIRAAHLARRNHDEAVRQLHQLVPTAAAADRLRLQLVHVQLLINKGELISACDELGKLTDVSGLPGVVSTRVALCKRAGDNTAASQILREAVQHNRQSANGEDLTLMWRRAAEFHLKCGDAQAAASLLEQLLKTAPKDKRTVAQLVVAYSQFDQQKARAVSSGLPPPQTASSVDVAALETAGWSSSGRLRRAATAAGQHSPGSPSPGADGGDAAGSSAVGKKKKQLGSCKRRRRLPAGCTGGAPDPERWLPRRERSSYKPRKRRRNDPLKGTQGGPSAQSDLYDITKTAPQQKASPVPDQSGSAPRQRNAQKKRKQTKRSGRW